MICPNCHTSIIICRCRITRGNGGSFRLIDCKFPAMLMIEWGSASTTVSVDEHGKVSAAAPLLGNFIGKTADDLFAWLNRVTFQGGFKVARL